MARYPHTDKNPVHPVVWIAHNELELSSEDHQLEHQRPSRHPKNHTYD
jgi:hypothetical protein